MQTIDRSVVCVSVAMDPTDLVEVDLQVEKTKKCLDRWMENLPEEAHSLPLHCLAIPGENIDSFIHINLDHPQ